ncbi:hypothetical protein [Listeria seeligeri]|uniref:hypothetical protein n=1 Tax=Listeria seeligeri TaxID=1640 RepID=UPI0015E7AC34|nr:hypothetical protein [Listeria seeligeri]
MRTETVITQVKCDICGNIKSKEFSVYRKLVAVLELGYIDEYGYFHKDISKSAVTKYLDLCKTCAEKANDRVIKSKFEMFTDRVYYSFQDVEEVME